MANQSTYAASFLDWEGLIAAVDRNSASLPGAEPAREALQTLLEQGKNLKLQQEGFAGSRQGTTEQLRDVLDEGREAARMLRAFVTSRLGSRSEVLAEYKIPPSRSRKVKRTKTPTPPPPAPEVQTAHATDAAGKAEPQPAPATEAGASHNPTAP
ncbi:MAG TPA: hypothetical protein VIE43_05945 [Thermoanaerobaculia bacterium]|jgi:hypothetical protein|nr:hypothetical protein [Thermoanaerobaculia bacterium]